MMLCCMPSIPLGGKLCINKGALSFAPAEPLFRFFLNNNKLEYDALQHSDKVTNGKELGVT